jgi:hypothetical protein
MQTIETMTVSTGYGRERKTKKSAQREADAWNASGDGSRYLWNNPENHWFNPAKPTYFETCVAEVQQVEGGFVCVYVTTREFVTTSQEA